MKSATNYYVAAGLTKPLRVPVMSQSALVTGHVATGFDVGLLDFSLALI